MSLYGPLGYVQIASDFRIITTLQKQIDDLPLPGSYLIKLFLHALHLTDALLWPGGDTAPLTRIPEIGSFMYFVGASARPLDPELMTKVYEFMNFSTFLPIIKGFHGSSSPGDATVCTHFS